MSGLNLGQVIVDIQLVRRATKYDPYLELTPHKELVEAAEKRLAAVNVLELVKAVVEYTRTTGEHLKI